mmetsp:Transcript_19070/g.27632  ORF Transcript_19070/g.27632 Transcript_19070/m.27632 type:complete len:101 (-) Transcript_19070:776-1078(-)
MGPKPRLNCKQVWAFKEDLENGSTAPEGERARDCERSGVSQISSRGDIPNEWEPVNRVEQPATYSVLRELYRRFLLHLLRLEVVPSDVTTSLNSAGLETS